MSFATKIKKILLPLLFTISLSTVLSMIFANSVFAYSMGDFGSDVASLFDTGEQGLSFTQYEGQLAQLSPEGYDIALTSSGDVREFVIRIVNFALGFLGLIAVIIVIYGGVLYVTAAGEEEKTQTGKKAITYAVIGLLIVLGSFAFVNTVIKGATSGSDSTGGSFEATGAATAGGFNAAAEQVRGLAIRIFNGFLFLEEVTEDLKNIKNDAEKVSLDPANWPSKSDILNFLNSVQIKLNTLKTKMEPFSVAEARINDLLRDVEKELDTIDRLSAKKYTKVEGGSVSYCDVDGEREFWEGLTSASDQEICRDAGFNTFYTVGLYEEWKPLREKYIQPGSDETNLYNLIKPVGEDYATELASIFSELDEIFNRFKNIQAIGGENSAANTAYQFMKSGSAYGFNASTSGEISVASSGALKDIQGWTLDSSISDTGTFIIAGLEKHATLYEELKNIQFVQARLTADVVEGSAPLPVIFDILGSVDPAGGSVQGRNITWDLAGTLSTSDFIKAEPGKTIPALDGSVDCTFSAQGDREEEFIGNTAKRCIFTKPGTYTAAVKIESNEPTKYAPGISVLTIKVHPPTTKIELMVETGGRSQTVMHYLDDVLVTDLNEVTVTVSDANAGITFDASKTDAEQFKWDFGDGEVVEFSSSGTKEHSYEEPGKYEVTLEVVNALGVLDKKLFTIEVSSIAARLSAKPASGAYINEQVTFDASDSKSDLGAIVNYSWKIIPSAGQNIPPSIQEELNSEYPFEDSGSNLKTLTHKFKYPINYDISVEVTDNAHNKDSFIISNYRVKSQSPIALFDFAIPNTTQPATVHFDGENSYDPDGDENFIYEWKITPETGWKIVDSAKNGLNSKKPIIKFTEKGDYEVSLKITDQIAPAEFSEVKQTLTIDNILDIAWADDQQVTYVLDENGSAEVDFKLVSDSAIAYDIDFGDTETANGEFGDSISHIYSEGGRYQVQVTVYDAEDNANTIQRKFFISGGDKPIAKIKLIVNGVEIQDTSQPVKVSKADTLTFDAGDSKNLDGTGRGLKYSWNMGDGRNNSKKTVDHLYNELSPKDPGYFIVKLTVTDQNDASKTDTDEIQIDVINIPPRFASVQGVIQSPAKSLITPVVVNVRAYGAMDPDGEIIKYKWWYFDKENPEDPLGVQITTTNTAQLTIGTKGQQGKEKTYGFGLEITDSDGLTFSNIDNPAGVLGTITVINGPNELPTASFNVDATAIFAGDAINFTSSSNDPDGTIVSYIWDFEGDGFFNNEPTTEATTEYIYTAKNKEGYNARLKVVDDKGGEAISQPIKIYVDSLAEPPVAAFKYEVLKGSGGMKIKFTNNSAADEKAGAKILSNKWDFDTDSPLDIADSDGDGMKDNDVDSQAKDPERLYIQAGIYKVKLTVTDDQGNTDDVVNQIIIPLAELPIAAFSYQIVSNQVVFQNNSTADAKTGAVIKEYIWDFDTGSALQGSDSDGDGIKDNDKDSVIANPTYTYNESGTYMVKLTVIDDYGNSDEVVNPVTHTIVPAGDEKPEDSEPEEEEPEEEEPETLLKAALITEPAPDSDNVVYLSGESGTVRFNFSKSEGPIAYYTIDKNIYFDTDGNGTKNDDADFKTSLPGAWTTNFEKIWGKIGAKLTVTDIYGNSNSTTLEIKFE